VILHEFPISSNAQKARFLLDELGLPYERRYVPPARPRPDWHVALNPLGGVPVLVDGDVVVIESNTVLRYLAAKAGRDDLYPAALADRARIDMLLDAIATSFRPSCLPLEFAGLGFRPGAGFFAEDADLAKVPALLEEKRPLFESFSGLLGPEPWAAFGRFTIADCAGAPVLHRLLHVDGFAEAFPRLAVWGRAATGRPGFAGVAADAGLD
jgi:glutathione S-transferase